MTRRRQVKDRHGRVWTVSLVKWDDAEEEDARFWFAQMTPDERVNAVAECLLSCLKARGINAIPRFRRVHRLVKCSD